MSVRIGGIDVAGCIGGGKVTVARGCVIGERLSVLRLSARSGVTYEEQPPLTSSFTQLHKKLRSVFYSNASKLNLKNTP